MHFLGDKEFVRGGSKLEVRDTDLLVSDTGVSIIFKIRVFYIA